MPKILQTFILPTDDIFRKHEAWLRASEAADINRLAVAERAIDPFLRAIRRLGVTSFTQSASQATDPIYFAAQYSKDYYEALPPELEPEFKDLWREVCTVFLFHGHHIYTQLAHEKPRLSVLRMIGGDIEIGLLSDSNLVQYI